MPAVAAEAHCNIVAVGKVGVAVDGDAVVVVHADEAAELEMTSHRCCFVAETFHEATIASDNERVVILHVGTKTIGQRALGDRHAHGVCETLSERTGCDFDTSSVAHLRVARGGRLPLTELLDVVEFKPVAVEEQH